MPTGLAGTRGDRPMVAVYFTGQARTLNRTICSVERHLFDPLVRQGFSVIVFVVGEADANAHKYAAFLGASRLPPNVELGGMMIIDRPPPISDEELAASPGHAPFHELPDPAIDPLLPTPIPRGCQRAFAAKGRWYNGGGGGPGSKNWVYSAEVLSQLYYKNVVDRMRRGFEKAHGVTFRWVVNARPDTVLVNDIPDLRRLDPEGVVYVPSWGHGYDPRASDKIKRVPGINDRFGFGGPGAMEAYHDLYALMCHDEMADGSRENPDDKGLPPRLNYEQMLHWYFSHPRIRAAPEGESGGGKVRATRHIPGEFWFFRLRNGRGTTPLEHPGHRPAMVTQVDESGAGGVKVTGGGLARKRWDVWAAATREAFMCQEGERVDTASFGGLRAAKPGSMGTAAAIECWQRRGSQAYDATEWVRWFFPRFMVPEPGGWLDSRIRSACGVVH